MIKGYRLRIREPLRLRIKEAARANHRSMNSEMNARLEQSFLWDAVRRIAKVRLGTVHNGQIDWEWFRDICSDHVKASRFRGNPQIENDIAGWAKPLNGKSSGR